MQYDSFAYCVWVHCVTLPGYHIFGCHAMIILLYVAKISPLCHVNLFHDWLFIEFIVELFHVLYGLAMNFQTFFLLDRPPNASLYLFCDSFHTWFIDEIVHILWFNVELDNYPTRVFSFLILGWLFQMFDIVGPVMCCLYHVH